MTVKLISTIFIALILTAKTSEPEKEIGFWRFDEPPIAQLLSQHGFKVDESWFDPVERSTIRIAHRGGAGALVSADGLVMLSRHQIEPWIREIGFVGPSILRDGFLASRRNRELRIKGLTAEQFDSFSDVTSEIREAAQSDEGEDSSRGVAMAIRALVESESTRTGLLCRVEKRDNGKRFVLFRFREFHDLRLVFAPETAIAYFGGDFDNFNFPRWSFDVAFLRLYKNEKPVKSPDFFSLSSREPKIQSAHVVAGFPGRTRRGKAWPIIENEKTQYLPTVENVLSRLISCLSTFSNSHPDHGESRFRLAELRSNLKAIQGYRHALATPSILERLKRREQQALGKGDEHAKSLQETVLALRNELEQRREKFRRRMYSRLESSMAAKARSFLALSRLEHAKSKDDGDSHQRGHLKDLRTYLGKSSEVDRNLEVAVARARVALAKEQLGENDPFVASCAKGANGKGAAEAIAQTQLFDQAFCVKLIKGAPGSIDESDDPLIVLVRELDEIWSSLWGKNSDVELHRLRELERKYHRILDLSQPRPEKSEGLGAPMTEPNGGPRITFGTLKGVANGIGIVPAMTSLWGLWARQRAMGGVSPFKLPPRWSLAKDKLDLDTPMVLSSTVDAVDNSEGSPVVDQNGALLGIVFDTNFLGLANTYVSRPEGGRALVLSSLVVLEALSKVYNASGLLMEIRSAK